MSIFDRFGGVLGSILARFEGVLGSILGRFEGDLEGYPRKALWEPQVRSWLQPPEAAAGVAPCLYARLARRSPSEVRAPREGRKVGGCPRSWQAMCVKSPADARRVSGARLWQPWGSLGVRVGRARRVSGALVGRALGVGGVGVAWRQGGRSPRVTCACT